MTKTARRAIIGFLERRFREEGDPRRAEGARAYMKSELAFHGVTAAQVRRAAADTLHSYPGAGRADLIAIARATFARNDFDLRSGAIALLERRAALLEPEDLPALIEMVRISSCWAHVDWLATKIVPPALAKLPKTARAHRIRRWARDSDLWVRRTALLVQHDELRRGRGDFALFAEIAAPMLEEKAFWIRKAIGWVLREASKTRPALVRGFMRTHGRRMSGLTRREAEKYL